MIVGQKVVCINDQAPYYLRNYYTTWVKKGITYVIRGVTLGVNFKGESGEVGLYLQGIHNPLSSMPPHPERAYNAERFRAIEDHTLALTEELEKAA